MLFLDMLVLILLILLGGTDVIFVYAYLANRVADDQAQEEQHRAAGDS